MKVVNGKVRACFWCTCYFVHINNMNWEVLDLLAYILIANLVCTTVINWEELDLLSHHPVKKIFFAYHPVKKNLFAYLLLVIWCIYTTAMR